MAEGIPVNLVEFSDNRPVLDMLLSRPLGLLALLDEESRFPRATDRSFIRKLIINQKLPIAHSSNPIYHLKLFFFFIFLFQKNVTTI